MARNSAKKLKSVETLKHEDATRKNIPSAEQQSIIQQEVESPKQVRYPRNTDLGCSFLCRYGGRLDGVRLEWHLVRGEGDGVMSCFVG